MIYIPGADYYRGSIDKTSRVYTRRKEAKGETKVRTNRSERLKAEGFSKSFAVELERLCDDMNIKMHSNQPTRKFVIRKRKTWVPALLRYCRIPTRVLIELANLQNSEDINRIKQPAFRDKLARMYVEALKNHYSNKEN
jgi:N-acetylmuramoyl-L-alanine amidase